MKLRMWFVPVSVLFPLLVINSCEKEGGCGETKVSSFSGHSHNAGQNCMNCHRSGGEGSGCFNVAGTVYDSAGVAAYPNATIRLYSQPGGTGSVVATILADGRGSFYTTDNINLGSGVYPSVTNSSGHTMYMSASVTTGACSSCHGISQAKLSTF